MNSQRLKTCCNKIQRGVLTYSLEDERRVSLCKTPTVDPIIVFQRLKALYEDIRQSSKVSIWFLRALGEKEVFTGVQAFTSRTST